MYYDIIQCTEYKNSVSFLIGLDAPTGIVATQLQDRLGMCSVHISWTLPKKINNIMSNKTMFAVSINGASITLPNEIDNFNETLFTFHYEDCSCTSHNVSIIHMNSCNMLGKSSPNITLTAPTTLHDLRLGQCMNPTPSDDTVATGGLNEQSKYSA